MLLGISKIYLAGDSKVIAGIVKKENRQQK